MEAAFYEKLPQDRVQCHLCPHACTIAPGKRGICRVRENQNGSLVALTYAQVASTAMDPIEKKPLYHFCPGTSILSIGTWGCNLKCSFCQNWSISQKEVPTQELTPENLATLAKREGSVGVAYTYNEPMIWWEYVFAAAQAVQRTGLKNVLVTNGLINPEPLEKLLPCVDAMNIDIKAFHEGFYEKLCGGRLAPVLATAERAAKDCHVELTTLVIPGHNDAPKELDSLAAWIAEHCGRKTPAHLSAYSPRYELGAEPTSLALLQRAREIFSQHLDYVYIGNVATADAGNTACHRCGDVVIARRGYATDTRGMREDGTCAGCGAANNIVMQ